MAISIQTYRPTITAGKVYLRVAGSAAPLRAIGNVSQLDIAISEDEKSITDYTAPGGGTWAAVSRISDVTANITLLDLDPVNLSRAVYGSTSDTIAGTVADAPYTAYQGGLVRLNHPNATSVVVKGSDSVAAAAGTDYEVRPEGIMILGGGIADAEAITVSYSYGAYSVIEAITTGSQIFELSFGGLNEMNSNSPVILDIYRLKMSAAKSLSMISADPASLEMTGKILMDSTKTGTGISKYYRVQMV